MTSHEQGVRVRRMELTDLDRVMEIAASTKNAPNWSRAAYLAAIDPAGSPRRVTLVAETSKELTGFAVASLNLPEAELEAIVTAISFQRRGVARDLFAFISEDLRREAVSAILLEVRASNLPAQAFYRAVSFVETGRRVRYYAEPVEDAILMRLELCPI
jgi:ribosomal-protein-alanine N-acetyltransferase